MGAVKHQPGTQLPFRAVGHRVMKYSTAAIIVADCQFIETDATYLAHAANAYPKLVEMLKNVSGCNELVDAKEITQALLRELGEAA